MAVSQKSIRFYYLVPEFSFRHRTKLKQFMLTLCHTEGREVEAINFIFCDDAYLLDVNRSYLNHDTYTDIITFQLSGAGQPLVSDVYISVQRVRENAHSFKNSFHLELHRVMFHGLLHLCGYKDKSIKERRLMREKEDLYLQLYLPPSNALTAEGV